MAVLVVAAIASVAAWQAYERGARIARAQEQTLALTALSAAADVALVDAAASERAYVAPGQGVDFWAARVDEAVAAVRTALTQLTFTSPDASSRAASAVSRLADFVEMDTRAREYLGNGQRGLAADLIFADGYEMIAAARNDVAAAAQAERAAIEGPLVRERAIYQASVGVLAALGLLAALLLLRRPAGASEQAAGAETSSTVVAPAPVQQTASVAGAGDDDAIGAALDASLEGLTQLDDAAAPASSDARPASVASPAATQAAPSVDLSSAADACVDLARLLDARDLPAVLSRAAAALGAEGLIVWMDDGSGQAMVPALTHGYPAALVGRLGALAVDDDNATAAAWRAKTLQVVDGALAVPLLTAGGCTGVLSVELKSGKERASDVQSLARIVAAQLAASVAAAEPGRRAAQA